MATSETQRRGDRAKHLAELLKQAIIAGEFPPNTPLRQEELARSYSSSRIPVREALRLLHTEGLVKLEPNKGAVVAPLDASELRENTEMREAAEVLAMRTALPHLSNAQIQKAASIQDQIESADIAKFGELNKAFHLALYEPCERPRLLAHISGLHDIAERYISFTLTNLDYVPRSSREHRAILDACYDRDRETVEALISEHILEAGKSLERFLSST